MRTIKSIYDEHCSHLKINDAWVSEFDKYVKGILVKNENTINFFGSILVGVYPVYYDRSDLNGLWDILVEADRDEIRRSLHLSQKDDPVNYTYIDKTWRVGGDVTNHLIGYLIHRVLDSKLSSKVKDATAINLLFILQFKFITSLLFRDYKHGVNRELALTVYNKLSRRFILRQMDSWKELLYHQARDMLYANNGRKDMRSILTNYDNDRMITDTITGISTNLNSMMIEYNAVFYRVKDDSDRISLDTKLGKNSEGEDMFKDNLRNPIRYQMHLESTINHSDTFINDELLTALTKTNDSRFKPIRKTLAHISQNYGARRQEDIKSLVDHTLEFGLSKVSGAGKDLRNVREVYDILIGAFSSSRSLDPTLEHLKKIGSAVVDTALGGKTNGNTLTMTRTMVMTYIVIWTILQI